MKMSCLLLVCLTALCVVKPSYQALTMTVAYEWNVIDYNFPNAPSKQAMMNQGLYIPLNNTIVDVDVYKDRVFVTTPRLKKGIPATLSVLSKQGNALSPLLEPYPDWGYHKPGHCHGLTSVFRIKIDSCGRMWVLDTGSIDIFTGILHVCPKKIVVFDLATDTPIRSHTFPQNVIMEDSILTAIEVDVRDTTLACRATFAYVADTTTYGLIVYDAKNDRSWRVTANSFWPDPAFGYFNLQGNHFDLMDGINSLALNKYVVGTDRKLYYHSLASNTENYVLTSVLQNENNFLNGRNTAMRQFTTLAAKRNGQSPAMAMSTTNVLFFCDATTFNCQCWKESNTYLGSTSYPVDADGLRLVYVSGMKSIPPTGTQTVETLYVISNRLQKYIDRTMVVTDVNFRILKAPISALIGTSNCL